MDSLRSVIDNSHVTFVKDLSRLIHLNKSFSHIPIQVGSQHMDLTFTQAEFSPKTKSYSLKARLTLPNHTAQDVVVLESKVRDDGFEVDFLQDVNLQGESRKIFVKPRKIEYAAARNDLMNELHKRMITDYSGKDGVKLVRKALL
jgi:hypothetical protein